jgi:hypothetical protein
LPPPLSRLVSLADERVLAPSMSGENRFRSYLVSSQCSFPLSFLYASFALRLILHTQGRWQRGLHAGQLQLRRICQQPIHGTLRCFPWPPWLFLLPNLSCWLRLSIGCLLLSRSMWLLLCALCLFSVLSLSPSALHVCLTRPPRLPLAPWVAMARVSTTASRALLFWLWRLVVGTSGTVTISSRLSCM